MPRPYKEGDGTEGCAGGEQLVEVRDARWPCSPLTAAHPCWQVHLLSAPLSLWRPLQSVSPCYGSLPVIACIAPWKEGFSEGWRERGMRAGPCMGSGCSLLWGSCSAEKFRQGPRNAWRILVAGAAGIGAGTMSPLYQGVACLRKSLWVHPAFGGTNFQVGGDEWWHWGRAEPVAEGLHLPLCVLTEEKLPR